MEKLKEIAEKWYHWKGGGSNRKLFVANAWTPFSANRVCFIVHQKKCNAEFRRAWWIFEWFLFLCSLSLSLVLHSSIVRIFPSAYKLHNIGFHIHSLEDCYCRLCYRWLLLAFDFCCRRIPIENKIRINTKTYMYCCVRGTSY